MDIKEFASMGGKARSIKLTPKERKNIATKGGNATKLKYSSDYYKDIRKGIKPTLVGFDTKDTT